MEYSNTKTEQVSWFQILLPQIRDAGVMALAQLGLHGHEQHHPVGNTIKYASNTITGRLS